nr:MAG TPA: hypothetical protein [Caudoviricetes sp.]
MKTLSQNFQKNKKSDFCLLSDPHSKKGIETKLSSALEFINN